MLMRNRKQMTFMTTGCPLVGHDRSTADRKGVAATAKQAGADISLNRGKHAGRAPEQPLLQQGFHSGDFHEHRILIAYVGSSPSSRRY